MNTYGPSASDRKLGRLTKAVVSKRRRASGTWGAALTRTSGFAYYGQAGCGVSSSAHAGMLCGETVEPSGGALKSETTHRYDAFGNLVRTAVRARGDDGTEETRCDFDVREHDSLGRLVKVERDCLGRKVREVSERDANWGLPTAVKVYLNAGATAHRTEKAVHTARGIEVFRAPGTGHWETAVRSKASHAQCPSRTAVHEVRKAAGGSESVSCLDVLGREVRVSELGFDGSWSRREVEHDASGRVSKAWSPHWSTDTSCRKSGTGSDAHRPSTKCATQRAYDLLGRLLKVTRPDGSTEAIAYDGLTTDGLTTTFTDAKGHARREVRNALGELVEVEDALGGTVGRERRADGHVVKVVRRKPASDSTAAPSKVEWTLVRDGLGRVTTSTDPDRGSWIREWNGFGELVRRTAPSGRYATFTHDALGRVTARREHGGAGGLELGAAWTWDTAPNGLGRLHKASESVSGHLRTHSYDALGRPRDASTAYGGATHYERTTYDQHGRVFQSFDASRESASYADGGVRHVYNSRGHLWKVQDAVLSGSTPRTVYWEAKEADALGRVVKEAFGNGAVRTLGHDGKTGRLRALTATRPSQASGDLQDLRFEWDAVGSLTKREDLTGSRDLEETFTYDGLRRMETSRVGSAASDAKSFSYDGYGNLRSKAGVGSYAYFASHPSRLRTAGSDSFTYDADGGMLTGSGRTMTYDAGGRMRSAARGDHAVRFVHGPDGGRIKRTDADSSSGTERTETTLYLGGVEKVTHADGTRTIRRRIGGMALEVRRLSSSGTETSRTTHYLLRDHLGSVSVIADSDATDDAGSAEGERSHGPWGLRRDAATWADLTDAQLGALPEGATRRGYTGHEMLDPVGLVHMNGRVYDPRLGRFLQADPYVGDPSDMLSLNRYAYAHGNPLSNVDPSGHIVFTLGALIAKAAFDLTLIQTIAVFAAAGFADALVSGASFGDALASGLVSGASAWAFGSLPLPAGGGFVGGAVRAVGYGTVGGVTSVLRGGRFGHGFVSAGLSGALAGPVGGRVGRAFGSAAVGEVVAGAAIGGTASELTGGKFANGAAYAAFASIVSSAASRAAPSDSQLTPEQQADLAKRQGLAMDEVKAAYESGDLGEGRQFSTIDDAAKEVLGVLDPISQIHKVELGGFISASGDGFAYGTPIVGTQGSLPGLVNVPSGALAGFHTHPSGSRSFSLNDARWVNGKNGTGIPLYLSGKGQVRVCGVSSYSCSLTKARFFPYDSNNPGLQGRVVP